MASIFLGLTDWIVGVVEALGYPGIFLLMVIEGILTPVPSEFIMPFAGFLAYEGRLNLVLVIAVGTAGAAIGNYVAYHIGARVGRPLISRYGRWIGLGEEELDWAEAWFAKYGNVGILLGHAVPGIRSFISFPAGIGRMRIRNSVLVVAGYLLVERWRTLAATTDNVDVYVAIAGVAIMVGYVYWRKARLKARAAKTGGGLR